MKRHTTASAVKFGGSKRPALAATANGAHAAGVAESARANATSRRPRLRLATATVRTRRAGYAIDRTLLYLTGGLAYGGLNKSPLGGNSTSDIGYAFGGGVEYAFTQNWTVKAEALYINLSSGRNQQFVVVNGGVSYPISVKAGNGGALARIGINYKF